MSLTEWNATSILGGLVYRGSQVEILKLQSLSTPRNVHIDWLIKIYGMVSVNVTVYISTYRKVISPDHVPAPTHHGKQYKYIYAP